MRKIQYSQYNSKEIREWIESSDENKQLADKAYKDYVEKNIRNFRLRVKLGTKELTSSDISAIKINSDLFSSDSFTIGSVIAETLELTLFTDTVFKTDDIDYLEEYVISKKEPIVPYIALRTEVEINGVMEEVWQEVCLGAFYINPDGINEDGLGIMSIRASSLFTHPDYSSKTLEAASSNSTIKRNLYKIIENVRVIDNHNNPNFTLKNTDLPDIEISDESGNVIGKSVREVINYISILYGGYARTTYENGRVYLEFVRLTQTNYAYDESSYVNLTRGGAGSGLNITQIKCRTGNEVNPTIHSGSGNATTNTVHLECPDMTQEQLNLILAKYKGHIFRPTTTKIFGNPLLEVGDITTVYGRGINSRGAKLPLHSVVYNITGSGVTMDIKALYKVADVARYLDEKAKEDEERKNQNKEKEEVSSQIRALYDRTTIQPAEEDKEEVTLKQDYLVTKESLAKLTKDVDDLKNSSEDGGGGNPPSMSSGRIAFTDNTDKTIGSIGSQVNSSKYLTTLTAEYGYGLALGTEKSGNEAAKRSIVIYNGDDWNTEYDEGNTYYRGLNIDSPIVHNDMKFGCRRYYSESSGQYEPMGYGEISLVGRSKTFRLSGSVAVAIGLHENGEYHTLSYYEPNPTSWGTNPYMNIIDADVEVLGTLNIASNSSNTRAATGGGNRIYSDSDGLIITGTSVYICVEDYLTNEKDPILGVLPNSTSWGTKPYVCILDGDLEVLGSINSPTQTSVSAQSEYTANLINSGTNENIMYGTMSYDLGEVRWCWKETVFTYKEGEIDPETDEWVYTGRHICYIELPIFLAENIQNDYHINVSKMSWGDYRIIEKNPYYFILESQEEDFAFTFEVVAKLNDNQTLDNNAIIANADYRLGKSAVNED